MSCWDALQLQEGLELQGSGFKGESAQPRHAAFPLISNTQPDRTSKMSCWEALHQNRIASREADTAQAIMQNQLLPACIIHDSIYHTEFTRHAHYDRHQASFETRTVAEDSAIARPDWCRVDMLFPGRDFEKCRGTIAADLKTKSHLKYYRVLVRARDPTTGQHAAPQQISDTSEDDLKEISTYFAAGFDSVVLSDYDYITLYIRNGSRFDVVRGTSQDARKIYLYALWRASVDSIAAQDASAQSRIGSGAELNRQVGRAARDMENLSIDPPADNRPANDRPANTPHAIDPPANNRPADESPANDPPADDFPADGSRRFDPSTMDIPMGPPDSSSETDESDDDDDDRAPPISSDFEKGQKLCLQPRTSRPPPAPVTFAASKAIVWTREQLAKLKMSDAIDAYEYARTAHGIAQFGDYPDDAPGRPGSAASIAASFAEHPSTILEASREKDHGVVRPVVGETDPVAAQQSCSSAPPSCATPEKSPPGKSPRIDLHINQTSSDTNVLGEVPVGRRKYPYLLVKALHHNANVDVRIREILPSSKDAAILRCRLSGHQKPFESAEDFILKFHRDSNRKEQEEKAYQVLTAEQGDLIPYFYGEFRVGNKLCLAIEYVPGPTLLRCPNILQNADTVYAFLRKFEHRWLALLFYNMAHGNLSPHNIIITEGSTPVLVDLTQAWRVSLANNDYYQFYCQLFRSTLAMKAGQEDPYWPEPRLYRSSGVPLFLHCSAQRAYTSAVLADSANYA